MKAMPYISCQLYNYKVLELKETLPMSFTLGGKHWSTPNKEYNQTIIMITHNMEIAKEADRIISIEDGKIVNGN